MTDQISAILAKNGLPDSADCLRCDVCCRFPEPTSALAPFFGNMEIDAATGAGVSPGAFLPGEYGPGHAVMLQEQGSAFACPAFRETTNDCAIYAARPLDCRLYPFMLMFSPRGDRVLLGVDQHCAAVCAQQTQPAFASCAGELAEALDGTLLQEIVQRRGMVTSWKDHILPVTELPTLSQELCKEAFGLSRLVLSARSLLQPFFEAQAGQLSTHAFAPIIVWSDVFDLYWKISGERLLIIAEADGDTFLLTQPIGTGDILGPAEEARDIMRRLNPDAPSPRIQDVAEHDAAKLACAGWQVRDQRTEYIYQRERLAELRGNQYEKKRQMCNRFEREREWEWRTFESNDFPAVVALYRSWLAHRCRVYPDLFFTAQAEASLRCVCSGLRDAADIGLLAYVLEADGRLAGFTAGLPLHDGETFYVLFEVSDLTVKGAAQFIFRQFCREAAPLRFINTGGASGLANLARVKESYRPCEHLSSSILA